MPGLFQRLFRSSLDVIITVASLTLSTAVVVVAALQGSLDKAAAALNSVGLRNCAS